MKSCSVLQQFQLLQYSRQHHRLPTHGGIVGAHTPSYLLSLQQYTFSSDAGPWQSLISGARWSFFNAP